jgi:hypothetical protein
LDKKPSLSSQLNEILLLANDQEVASTLANRRGARPKIAITRMAGDGVVSVFTNYKTSGGQDPRGTSEDCISHTEERISRASTGSG